MDSKKKYLQTLTAMAVLSANAGKDFREKLSFVLQENFDKVLLSYHNEYMSDLLQGETDTIYKSVGEYQSLLEAIPNTSYETRKIANDKITEVFKKVQEEKLYDPYSFYNIYFSLNTADQNTLYESPFYKQMKTASKTGEKLLGRNENFATWFSNSKVVDENKDPLVVFHGTGANEFTRFNFDRFPVAYFAENKDYSEWFQKARGGDGVMFTCYLRIQNPIDLRLFGVRKVSYDEFVGYIQLKYGYELPLNTMLKATSEKQGGLWAWQYIRGGVEWLKLIKNNGYFDGFKYFENNPDQKVNGKENVTPAWALFNAEQIKSARGNVTFSYDSKDIRFEKGGVMYSFDEIANEEFDMDYDQLGENEKEWVRDEQDIRFAKGGKTDSE